MDITVGDLRLTDLLNINVVLGKNGSGKSTLLKRFEHELTGDDVGTKKYITPERGGTLSYQANVEQNHSTGPTWLSESRRVQSVSRAKRCPVSSPGACGTP